MPIQTRQFYPNRLRILIGGESILDSTRLKIQSDDDAYDFILGYGYDLHKEEHRNELWRLHARAIRYLNEEILKPDEALPPEITDPSMLKDIKDLLIIASTQGHNNQKWACVLLKVIHVLVHLEHDLFSHYQSLIQEQILKPIESEIHEDPVLGITLGPTMGEKSIMIKSFDVKSFKSVSSSITKLLAKRNLSAFNLMDKVGVRIVTKRLIDVFKVLGYFLEKHVVSFPHTVADQSNNTMYPLSLFIETLESLNMNKEYTDAEVDQILLAKLEKAGPEHQLLSKASDFSSHEYKFIKFIIRRLIRIPAGESGGPGFSFFYPFEVQIVDYATHIKNMTGDASHDKYKERQISKARARLFGTK